MEGKKNCGNSIAKIERKKKNCCNWFAKNWRRERVVWIKKKIVHILLSFSSVFLLKQFGLCVCHVLSFCIVKVPYETNNDRFKYNEYIDSYSKKKVHRFLFRFLSMHERKLWKKKMINVHTVNKQKTKKLRFL